MNINIVSTQENKLFDRKEVRAEIGFDGPTPKRAELKQAIGGKIGANPELMVLRRVESSFGKKAVGVLVHVYDKKELILKNEPRYISVREGLAEKKAKAKKAAPKSKPKS